MCCAARRLCLLPQRRQQTRRKSLPLLPMSVRFAERAVPQALMLSLFSADLQGTVYISKSRSKGRPAIYRFSLNASIPAPWQMVSPGDGEVPSFQVSQSRDGGPLYQECSTQQVSTRASCHSTGPWVAQGEGHCSKGSSTEGIARGEALHCPSIGLLQLQCDCQQ